MDDQNWVDGSLLGRHSPADASTHARGEGDASAASADPSPTLMETQAGQTIDEVKMIDENIKALSRHEGGGVLEESAAKIARGEIQGSQLAAPHNVEQMDAVDKEDTESSGRPPSY